MNDFVTIVQWGVISSLLFLGGFELAAQVVENNMQWHSLDYSLQLLITLISLVVYQCNKLPSRTKN
jgi:hypothetical protein